VVDYVLDPFRLGNVVGEYLQGQTQALTIFEHGNGLVSRRSEEGNGFFAFDALGNTSEVVGEASIITNAYAYLPFGELQFGLGAVDNPVQFVGESGVVAESNSLVYMRARSYSSQVGRFVSPDPIGLRGHDNNLYRYAGNNPIQRIDPSGLLACGSSDCIVCEQLCAICPPGLSILSCSVGCEHCLTECGHCKDFWDSKDFKIIPGVPGNNGGSGLSASAGSGDPNQLIGPAGYTIANYILPNLFAYTIVFENETNATAPAQFVQIADPLSTNLDWQTFELTEIAFGDQFIAVPPHSLYFETNMPLSFNGEDFELRIQAGINLATGQVFANFNSIDPLTGLPPSVTVGFLPAEDGTGRGTGHISYRVRPKPNLTAGTPIRNVAYIQFDVNPIISTDQINPHDPAQGFDTNKQALVTIDNGVPSSQVTALPSVTTNTSFQVCWSGTDIGSGITGFDIYASTNNGTWGLWIGNTTNACANFQGQVGNLYSFYSIAHDGVGNYEAAPLSADAYTVIAPHLPPQIIPVPDQFIAVGQSLVITNHASDPDLPITFSLGPGAPAGTSITTNGIFRWTPACSQASTTNLIIIWATDSYSIPLSNSISFVVTVSECLQVGIGSTVMQTGTTSSVPVTLISTLGLTNLSFTLPYPANRFTNWVIAASNSAIGAAIVQTIDASQTMFGLTPKSGQMLQGPALLGSLYFKALPGSSAFIPLAANNIIGTKTDGSAVGNASGAPGRVVVIGPEPLLEAWLGTNSQRMLTLYGNPGASYALGSRTNVIGSDWQFAWRTPMTNLFETFGAGAGSPLFYRAWEFFADPPILEIFRAGGSQPTLLLYGLAGTTNSIQSNTNLSAPSVWLPWTNFTLTNSFQLIGVGSPTNGARFFRAVRP
jgi:RHS repeat-associated protein